ncbi:MAG: hypothetical protein J6B98_07325 [Bacilli bacterium]|nr:hypothetical protein [Bacilli bacterium]
MTQITFEELKNLFLKYKIIEILGKVLVVDRETEEILQDKEMCSRVKFSHLWLKIVGTKWVFEEPYHGYYYAYEVEEAKSIFNSIIKYINENINIMNTIDTIDVLSRLIDEYGEYEYGINILVSLFSNNRNLKIICEVFKIQKSEKPIQVLNDCTSAILQVVDRQRLKLDSDLSGKSKR